MSDTSVNQMGETVRKWWTVSLEAFTKSNTKTRYCGMDTTVGLIRVVESKGRQEGKISLPPHEHSWSKADLILLQCCWLCCCSAEGSVAWKKNAFVVQVAVQNRGGNTGTALFFRHYLPLILHSSRLFVFFCLFLFVFVVYLFI